MNIPCNFRPLGNGGVPPVYIPCSFLVFDEKSTFDTDVTVDDQTGFSFDCCRKEGNLLNVVAGNFLKSSASSYVYATLANKGILGISGSSGSYYLLRDGGWGRLAEVSAETGFNVNGVRTAVKMNWLNNNKFSLNFNGETSQRDMPFRFSASELQLSIGNGSTVRPLVQAFNGSLYRFTVSQGSQKVRDYIPALSVTGEPVLYDTVKKRHLINSTDILPVPAFTLTQARQLGKLEANGRTLTIALPVGYEEDEKVQEAISAAMSKGWEILVQTYTAAAAATYSLRRVRKVVWVRKLSAENGSYVDASGLRWQTEWCSAIYSPRGNDPTLHGYEPFDSVEQAVEAWGLVPYEEPELEQEEL